MGKDLAMPLLPAASQRTVKAEGHGAGALSSLFNIVTDIIGADFVSLPFCIQQTSLYAGLVMMAAMCLLNMLSAVMIAECCEAAGVFDFFSLGERAFGKRFGELVQATVALYVTGSCISYIVLIGDYLTRVATCLSKTLPIFASLTRERLIVGVAIFVLCPMSLQRNLHNLKWSSCVGVVFILYTTCLVLVDWLAKSDVHAADVKTWDLPLGGLFQVLPIFSVAFTAHYNMPRYYSELGTRRSVSAFTRVLCCW
eukprot:TRINITY_DN30575_c0_g1_i2.p1 TRINITY_DN30575_c0_g1~~TRINITY_DN30575_c0_g1_i2.p1  ORF type:complete len:254 (-),score=24.14 TRINITY_DN30575_c0_g1_i2:41-802(-)